MPDPSTYQQLLQEAARLADAYYNEDSPLVSDDEYDALMRRIEHIESIHPEWIAPHSPTQRILAKARDKAEKVPHSIPMRSLDNAFSLDQLIAFFEKTGLENEALVAEVKLDGLAISIEYTDGHLTRAMTRGDGLIGENVTPNIKTIRGLPLVLNMSHPPKSLIVRGEVYMNKNDFMALNQTQEKKGLPPFANPRNAAAGSLRQLDSKITSERPLKIFLYQLFIDGYPGGSSHHDALEKMRQWHLPTNPFSTLITSSEKAQAYYDQMHPLREGLPYEIDGLVFKVNDYSEQARAGHTLKSPKWAIAYKFPAKNEISRIRGIESQVGRTGVITPVAHIEPVFVGGVTVSYVTLHNFEDMYKKDVRIGDEVWVKRAGDVIPEITGVVPCDGPRQPVMPKPATCPSCDAPLAFESTFIRCTNMMCQDQVTRRILHFVSRKAMNIDGLGHSLIKQLVKEQLIVTPADLYQLDKDTLSVLPRMGRKSADNILNALQKSLTPSLAAFIYALGIREVGQSLSKTLADHFQTFDALLEADENTLLSLNDVGPQVSYHIYKFVHEPSVRELYRKMLEAGLQLTTQTNQTTLAHMHCVLTGKLTMLSRAAASEALMAQGAEVQPQLSSKTTHLIAGEKAGSKLAKAQRLGITILTEKDLMLILSLP